MRNPVRRVHYFLPEIPTVERAGKKINHLPVLPFSRSDTSSALPFSSLIARSLAPSLLCPYRAFPRSHFHLSFRNCSRPVTRDNTSSTGGREGIKDKRVSANRGELWIYRYEGASPLSSHNAMLQPAVMNDGVQAGPVLVLHVSRASITGRGRPLQPLRPHWRRLKRRNSRNPSRCLCAKWVSARAKE